jgi:hypothetical protein
MEKEEENDCEFEYEYRRPTKRRKMMMMTTPAEKKESEDEEKISLEKIFQHCESEEDTEIRWNEHFLYWMITTTRKQQAKMSASLFPN